MADTSGQTGQAGTAKPGSAAGRAPDALERDPFGVGEWLKAMPPVPLHPLLTHPSAAMAAAAALGFGITSQMAGAMVGAMQGALETMQKNKAAGEEQADIAVAAIVNPEPTAATGRPAPALKSAAKAPVRKAVKKSPVRKPVAAVADVAPVAVSATDLKQISGIGPKLEQALRDKGLADIKAVAGLSAAKAAKLDEALGLGGRIARDDWVGQAKSLLKG